MKKPIIGISASMIFEEKDELFLGDKYSCVAHSYVDAIYKSGGIPVVLPILKDVSAIREQVKLLDGLILSGGRDVDPHFYGEEPLEKLGAIFPERDVHEMALIKAAIDLKKPIFAICRGMQILNVTYGGTLYQDISYAPGEHIKHCQIGSPYQATHSIKIDKHSTLFRMADKLEIERVNSFHHQALKQVAKGLRVVATAPDGIIEAVENEDGAFIIGVQFHPEMMFDKSTFARGIFKKFISICIESKPGEVILKDEIHHIEENKEKNQKLYVQKVDGFDDTFISLDVESTGLNTTKDSIIQFSAVLYKNGKQEKSFDRFVNPSNGNKISLFTTDLTGIKQEDVDNAKTFAEVWDEFVSDFYNGEQLVGQNLKFDLNIIIAELERINKKLPQIQYADTMSMVKELYPDLGSGEYKLEKLKKRFLSEETSNLSSHNSLNDCIIAGELYLFLLKQFKKNKWS